MRIKAIPKENRLSHSKWAEYLLLAPSMLYDLAYMILRPLLVYAAPIAFAAIGIFLMFGMFMDMSKDTASVSNTVTVLWVTLSALGFTWASAIEKENKDFQFVMELSKRFMFAAIALILATGFKFALTHLPHNLGIPILGNFIHIVLVVIMACFFAQSMLEAFLPLLQLHTYLSRRIAYLPGLSLLRKNLPGSMEKIKSWFHSGGGGEAGGEAGAPA